MRPQFGSDIHELVFEPLNAVTLLLVESKACKALTEFEPRIELVKVKASRSDRGMAGVELAIEYRICDLGKTAHLVLWYDWSEDP